ncbi:phytanoyl-CoA dioxygenase family protein [Archangium lansingense]|uniref:Phytanoyl-CoA dioxygenase family protein n=1 Tax=Archangium lansingense TaxID=2995310 RepID=A0ABT4AMI2_9BACT|nr:phytanoyl-CoA dioxygenase family protein [Archangium lansinium]MCY1082905.1 phytanoyl-CoA dioxygenase family protein [Archangium lansinium]
MDSFSPTERQQLELQGWLVLPGVLSAAELATMHAAWERLAAALPNEGASTNWGPDLDTEPTFAVCRTHPSVLAALGVLLDNDVHVRRLHGRSPPRGHGRQGLHVDWSSPAPPGRQILANAFWVLDDLTRDNGATRIVPGSHRWARVPRGHYAQPQGVHPEERVLEAHAGDVIVFSSHLWHAGSCNDSGRRRRVVLAQFGRRELASVHEEYR